MTEPEKPLTYCERAGDTVKVTGTGIEITIQTIRVIDGHSYFVSTDGEVYTEEELDLHFTLAKSMIIFDWLKKWHLDFYEAPNDEEYDMDVFGHMFADLKAHLNKFSYDIVELKKS